MSELQETMDDIKAEIEKTEEMLRNTDWKPEKDYHRGAIHGLKKAHGMANYHLCKGKIERALEAEPRKIKVFYNNQPVLEEKWDEQQKAWFGLNRDRNPDTGWGEYRWSRMGENDKEKELDPVLARILVEDIIGHYHNNQVFEKLREFDLKIIANG